jgi:hypothetical protein
MVVQYQIGRGCAGDASIKALADRGVAASGSTDLVSNLAADAARQQFNQDQHQHITSLISTDSRIELIISYTSESTQ